MKHLPKELTSIVGKLVALLGDVIKEEGGTELFKTVEKVRVLMTKYRNASKADKEKLLNKVYKILGTADQEKVALSYTLMLELINSCEAAYRTFRLQEPENPRRHKRQDNTIVYVLTAHPTEARSSQNIELFQRIQNLIIRILDGSGEEEYMCSIIKHNLKLAWLLPITLHEKPQVVDEANHIFSILMRSDIFDTILRADRDLGNIRVRTWVGGDKDGHPGVDEKVMLACLEASRKYFIKALERVLEGLKADIDFLNNEDLIKRYQKLYREIATLETIVEDDFDQIIDLKKQCEKLNQAYIKVVGESSPRLRKIEGIFKLFPALVIPIEIREDAEVVKEALTMKMDAPIYRMLSKLNLIAGKDRVQYYAQGFILSMCHSYEDIEAAIAVLKSLYGQIEIPVIPLFETARALDLSEGVVKKMMANKELSSRLKKDFKKHFEVMLGYSDSSKGMGVLPSRLGIAKTIRNLDVIISKKGFVPVFFHGSGGSVDRGGGSLKDQTAWWPKSALHIYKATIQGEMVERNFTSPEVSMSGMNKILESFNRSKSKQGNMVINKPVEEFADLVKENYIKKLNEDDFFRMIEAATPYSYLSELKLGSRPAKRSTKAKLDLGSIRAIPWILCWTQTRILFPTWWGVGQAWRETKKEEKKVKKLQASVKSSYLFASYIRVLGFTLSKVELEVFKLYLDHSQLDSELKESIFSEFEREYNLAVQFVRAVSGERDLLWYRPWLADSIKLRSSMIHPLNVIQIYAYQNNNMKLLRKTVAGISSGMMTTG